MSDNHYEGGDGKIFQKSAFTTTVQDSYSIASIQDIAWDDTDAYSVDFGDTVKRYSTFTSTVKDSFDVASNTYIGVTTGKPAATSNTYAADPSPAPDRYIKYSGFSTTVVTSIDQPADNTARITWDGTDFYAIDNSGNKKTFQFTAFTTTVKDSFSNNQTGSTSIAIDTDADIYAAGNAEDRIVQHSGFSSTVTTSIATKTASIRGLDWDSRLPAPPPAEGDTAILDLTSKFW